MTISGGGLDKSLKVNKWGVALSGGIGITGGGGKSSKVNVYRWAVTDGGGEKANICIG